MNDDVLTLKKNAPLILERVRAAQKASPYGQKVTVCAATKTRSPELINLLPSLGITTIGENRVQELLAKYDSLDKSLDIQFIGTLQTNKVKYIIDKVSLIQSVDRMELALEIDRQAKKRGIVMKTLCEINVAGEASKSGIPPESASEFIKRLSDLENISVCGLMCVPPVCVDKYVQKEYFQRIFELYIDIFGKIRDNNSVRILSQGMSGDFETAIEAGSTMVRIGTALFGPRDYNNKQIN